MVPNKHSSVSLAHTPCYGTSVLNWVCTEGRVQTHDRTWAWGKNKLKKHNGGLWIVSLSQRYTCSSSSAQAEPSNQDERELQNHIPNLYHPNPSTPEPMFSRVYSSWPSKHNLETHSQRHTAETQLLQNSHFSGTLDNMLSSPCTLWNSKQSGTCAVVSKSRTLQVPCSPDLILPNYSISRTPHNQKHTFQTLHSSEVSMPRLLALQITLSPKPKFSKTHELSPHSLNFMTFFRTYDQKPCRIHSLQIPYSPKPTISRTSIISIIKAC